MMSINAAYSRTGGLAPLRYDYYCTEREGFRQKSDYFREGHTLSGNISQNEKHQLSYLFNQTYLKSYIASSVSQTDFEQNPSAAAGNWLEAKGFEQYENWMGGLDYLYKINSKMELATAVYFASKEAYEPR